MLETEFLEQNKLNYKKRMQKRPWLGRFIIARIECGN